MKWLKMLKRLFWSTIGVWVYRLNRFFYWGIQGYQTVDFDAYAALELFRVKICKVRKNIERHHYHEDDEKVVVRMKEFECILQRLIDDNYFYSLYDDNFNFKQTVFFQDGSDEHRNYEIVQRNQDIDFLATYMKKYFQEWWE